MNKILTFSLILLCLGCSKKPQFDDTTFDTFKSRFILAYWKQNPIAATSAGYHHYDSLLPAYTETYRNEGRQFCKTYLDSLNLFKPGNLQASNRLDWVLLQNALTSQLFYVDTFKAWQWDPSGYNIASSLAEVLQAKNITNSEKLSFIEKRLAAIPAYYKAAMENIVDPTAEHIKLAIEQNEGTVNYILGGFCAEMDKLMPGMKACSENKYFIAMADEAIRKYIEFLKAIPQKPNYKARDFRIGKTLYERKFELDIQSKGSAVEIYQKALIRKRALHRQMAGLTSQLWTKYFKEPQPKDTLAAIQQLIQKIADKHAHRDSFMESIEAQIPQLTKFVSEKNLLYLDPKKPLKVRRTPAYMDGVAGASISAPGPYDSDAETFYNVSTLEKMSAEQAESYLREYNFYVLQILNIHEAIPGHYAQLVYANQSPSLVKTLFGNGAMIEGWAVYSERMMLENGYGNNEPEMELMYCKWHLRSVCNTILDYSVHVLGWDQNQAMDLLVNQAFQQDAEARGKWRRVSLTQVQLCSYFSGYTEIYELRERLKQKGNFDLKTFHEKLLSYGSSPVKEIAQMMK
ncbi:MAG: DUF885 domain-containing protein [Bacteroidota bacterium]|nr:DUF885 domain-containing protein [Bacteroidota bacterium]